VINRVAADVQTAGGDLEDVVDADPASAAQR
jgi:hypothetical protein